MQTARNEVKALLSAEQIHRYRMEGWLHIPGILNAADLAVVRRVCQDADTLPVEPHVGIADPKSALGQVYAHQAHANYRKMMRSRLDLRFVIPELRPLIKKLADYACCLLGTDDVRILYDKTVHKPPVQEGTRATHWHQDLPSIPVDRRGVMTFWIPAQDVTVESGALRFVPRSHRLGPLGRPDSVGREHSWEEMLTLPEDREIVGDVISAPISAGDCTVHDGLLLHGATPNMTSASRMVWSCIIAPGATLYNGMPFSHANFSEANLTIRTPFDHPDFSVENYAVKGGEAAAAGGGY